MSIYKKNSGVHNGKYCHIHCFADNIGYENWMNPKKKYKQKKTS